MKNKVYFIMMFLLLFTGVSFAQGIEAGSVWIMYEIEFDGEPQAVNTAITFEANNILNVSGKYFGEWQYNEAENSINIVCDLLMTLEGDSFIEKNVDGELFLRNPEGVSKFRRISLLKDEQLDNPIVGSWELKEIDGNPFDGSRKMILNYNPNGVFYQQDLPIGNWSYLADKNMIIQKSERQDSMELDGKAAIISLTEKEISYKLQDVQLTFIRYIENSED